MATLHGANIIILDDGLQNYSLHQDLKIIVVDGGFGFGNEFPLPAGPLRESISSGIKKSDILILFNKDKNDIEKKIKNKITIIHAKSKIEKPYHKVWLQLISKRIVAFSGIGRPEKFHSSLKKDLNLNIVKFFPFPDHYSYSKKKINDLIEFANKNNCILVSTKKDEQRIIINQRKKIIFLDLKIELKEKNYFINFLKENKIV